MGSCLIDDYAPEFDPIPDLVVLVPPYKTHGGSIIARERPFQLEYMRTMAFILIIAVVVQFTELVVQKTSATLHRALGIYLPLITTNCAVLGVALLNTTQQHSLLESAIYGLGAALGFSLVLILFSAMRERLQAADVPQYFQGSAISMITAGLMSLAFMGFAGLVK